MRILRNEDNIVLLFILTFAISCTPYVVLKPMDSPIDTTASITVGAITDQLPLEMNAADKPTMEEIDNFRDHLYNELSSRDFADMRDHFSPDARYEVTGEVIDYRRGSGAVRFFIGFGLGNARIALTLKLIDRANNETVFSGNFAVEIRSWMYKEEEMYSMIAVNFADALEKQNKKAVARQ